MAWSGKLFWVELKLKQRGWARIGRQRKCQVEGTTGIETLKKGSA